MVQLSKILVMICVFLAAVLQPHTDASCEILPVVAHVGSLRI